MRIVISGVSGLSKLFSISISRAGARQFIHDLQAEGLIEPSTHEFDKDAYQQTRDLVWDGAARRRPLFERRETRHSRDSCKRAKDVNASDDFLCSVEAVVLFGSYLKGEERPNDVDVAVKLKICLLENWH